MLKYLTVNTYAALWNKTPGAIYLRISAGRLFAIPEPGGGKGLLIPVCECKSNPFPSKNICVACEGQLKSENDT